MRFTALFFASYALAYGVQNPQHGDSAQSVAQREFQQQAGMSGVQGAVTNHQQVIDTLNHQLRQAGGDPHAHADAMVAYITGADSQIDNAIATVSNALAPFTFGASKAIGDFLLGPFVQSVTNGAEVFLANMVGGAQDRMDAALIGRLTGNYSRLVALSSKHGVDASKLQSLNQQITNSLPKAKRDTTKQEVAQREMQQQAGMSGIEGAITNHQQVMDTLNHQLQANGAHANAARIAAYITGADSQIDNAIATVSDALAPFTLGVSKAIGNFLLGPFVQSVTNGAEVLISNLIGGAEDTVSAAIVGQLTGNYARLIQLSSKNGVDTSRLQHLNQQLTQTLPKMKRDISRQEAAERQFQQQAGMSGVQGAVTNHQQVIDTLNHQLRQAGGDPHAHADAMVAYITGADSQIDNAIATVSNALAPFTFGASKAIGDFLLGPFVQSVTNGAEVFLANMVGGAQDRMDAALIGRLTGNYSRLVALSSKHGVDASKLQSLNQQIAKTVGH